MFRCAERRVTDAPLSDPGKSVTIRLHSRFYAALFLGVSLDPDGENGTVRESGFFFF